MKRKSYIPPEIIVNGVELESSICSGSVIMESTEKQIVIDDQAIDKGGSIDFSSPYDNLNKWD